MKYSLKNKEFSRKKHNIFDNNPRRSRSRTTSPTVKKQSPKKDTVKMHYIINVRSPSPNQTAVNKLNSFDSSSNSMINKSDEQELPMFQSFSKVEPVNLSSKQPLNLASQSFNINAIKPSEPIKFVLPSKTINDIKQKHNQEFSEPRSQSFQVCEDDNNPSRVNRFFAQSILAKQSESPMNKVVFEPVIRKSVSPQPKSLSPDIKIHQQQAFNKVTPINLKIQPQTKIIYHQPIHTQPLIQRKVNIIQIPREPIRVQNGRIVHPNLITITNPPNDHMTKNKLHEDEICELKRKVQDQDLQIQYLKNQKQILESNIELKFSPRKVSYHHQNEQLHMRTPQKHRAQAPSFQLSSQEIDRNKLMELTEILKHNQAKIMFLQSKYRSFYPQIYEKFNDSFQKCQDLLIKMFSQKYSTFTDELNAKISLIEQKCTQVQSLDHKIDLFNNTFRSIEENLRLTKLKLQNVQLFIQNKYKKSDRFWNKDGDSRIIMMENPSDISSIRIFNDNQLEEKDRQQLKRLERNLNKKQVNSQWTGDKHQDPIEFDSFLDEKYSHLVYNPKKGGQIAKIKDDIYSNEKYRKNQHFKKKQKSPQKNSFIVSQIYDSSERKSQTNNRSSAEQIEQFSPFQANQMFRNQYKNGSSTNGTYFKHSQTIQNNDFTTSNAKRNSLNNRNQKNRANLSFEDASSKHFDFSQNSFEVQMNYKDTPRNLLDKEISFTSQNIFKKNQSKSIAQNQDISDTLQGQQDRLVNILKGKNYVFPVECWLDEMGCLRKKNQTYIFDDQGSVIMTTPAAYKKLKEKRLIV